MKDPEPFDSSPDLSSDAKQLREQHNILRRLFLATLVAMLIVSGSLAVFLIRQVIFVRRDLASVRPQVETLMRNYQQVEEPQINSFVNSLVNFARSNPDFNPVLAKYKITSNAAAPVTPTGVPTTPVTK